LQSNAFGASLPAKGFVGQIVKHLSPQTGESEKELEGKIALITGAAGGIGRASALEFSSQGATVVIVAVKTSELAETAYQVRQVGGKVNSAAADVTDWNQMSELIDSVVKEHGRLDILFNSAGILGGSKLCAGNSARQVLLANRAGTCRELSCLGPFQLYQRRYHSRERGDGLRRLGAAARHPVI